MMQYPGLNPGRTPAVQTPLTRRGLLSPHSNPNKSEQNFRVEDFIVPKSTCRVWVSGSRSLEVGLQALGFRVLIGLGFRV